MSTLHVVPLSGSLGAEIGGIDLRSPLDEATVAGIRYALLEHRVLFFRAQFINPDQQIAFGRRFGELTAAHPLTPAIDTEHREVLGVDSNDAAASANRSPGINPAARWHTDARRCTTPCSTTAISAAGSTASRSKAIAPSAQTTRPPTTSTGMRTGSRSQRRARPAEGVRHARRSAPSASGRA